MRLTGRGAVVTGGGRGIGAAVARALGGAGARVVVAARTAREIDAVAAELSAKGHEVFAVDCDVTQAERVRELAATAIERLGTVDILANCAGAAHAAPIAKQDLADWDRLFAVNATGTLLTTQAFLPGMIQRHWGRIVNIASVAGVSGGKYIAAYSASKHAVMGLTRCVAAEVADAGVTVNAVCPGYVDTQMTRESIKRIVEKTGRTEEEALQTLLATTRQGRLLAPEEVAHAVLALCDEQAKGTNGQAIRCGRWFSAGMSYEIINPELLGRPRGWNNGMLASAGGRVLFVAGQAATDESGNIVSPEFVEQWDRALERVVAVVRGAGGEPEHIGRMIVYVTDREAYLDSLKPLGEVHRKHMGRHYPAMALVEVKALVDPQALLEIEATAVLP